MAAAKKGAALAHLMKEVGAKVETVATDDGLKKVSALVAQTHQQALEVARLTDELDNAKKLLNVLSTVDLPEAMKECGLEDFTTTDGIKVELKDEVNCGISQARADEAYQWLSEHGYGGIIKSDVDVVFTREELKKAEKLAQQLRAKGFDVTFNQKIHPQTLKAFVKERMADTEADEPFPTELFGVFPFTKANVKKVEVKRKKS